MLDLLAVFQKKPAWFIASFLSFVYIFAFVGLVTGKIPNVLLFGFCVWGEYDGNDPSMDGTFPVKNCTDFPINSHLVAFIIDTIMTVSAGLFYFLDKSDDKNKNWYYYPVMAFIIFIHGGLHWFLEQKVLPTQINCLVDPVPPQLNKQGTVLFAIFSFFLCLVVVGFGGFKLGAIRTSVISFVFALFVVYLSTLDQSGQYALQSLFVVIHPLSTVVGLLSDQLAFSPLVAKWFCVATLVGIIEALSCKELLRPFGGHIWYDLTLHAAVLSSLPYFWPTKAPKRD